ncbi:MAG: restriction endonuclease [Anaerolineaceae bacterium]|nr:restriction endonuclease [Anaerolineaceae bacterium]
MALPTYYKIMLPFLNSLRSGDELRVREIADIMSDFFALSEEERKEELSDGSTKIATRTWFASTYLTKAGLVHRPRRGFVSITNSGKELLESNPESITEKLLLTFPAYQEWRLRRKSSGSSKDDDSGNANETTDAQIQSLTPVEAIETNALLLNEQLSDELLSEILGRSPEFFERLIMDVMSAMGYGRGEHTGRSGDGGIDGVIDEDKLGLEKIYLQAKRYELGKKVSSPAIRGFIGSMASHGANKGVFITTSEFTDAARNDAGKNPHYRLVLIDGQELARLMIEYDVGVSEQVTWKLKRLDSDYFDPDL